MPYTKPNFEFNSVYMKPHYEFETVYVKPHFDDLKTSYHQKIPAKKPRDLSKLEKSKMKN